MLRRYDYTHDQLYYILLSFFRIFFLGGAQNLSLTPGASYPRYATVCDCPYCQARQTRPNSGGVAEGHPRIDKGGVAIFFLLFTR